MKDAVKFKEINGDFFKTKLVEPESNGRAAFTHYLQNYKSSIAKFYKKEAVKYVKATLQNQKGNTEEINSKKAEETLIFLAEEYINQCPFPHPNKADFKFIDLFAGIGGFRIAGQDNNGTCVFSSEWDEKAKNTYFLNFGEIPFGDITKEETKKFIPTGFDVLCGGFPCQPFSNAGHKKGFEDTRGTLFFDVADILDRNIKNGTPIKVVFLENVKGLKGHDKGNTLKTILNVLKNLGYDSAYEILNSKNFGLPQNRERIFIIAWLSCEKKVFNFPYGIDEKNKVIFDKDKLHLVKDTRVNDILINDPDEKFTISDKLYAGHIRRKKEHAEKGNGFGFSLFHRDSKYVNTISARYYKDGSEILISQPDKNPRKLTPREAANLQGYDEKFIISESNVQAYKQFGNSVSVPVIRILFNEIKKQLLKI